MIAIEQVLNQYGADGWELISIATAPGKVLGAPRLLARPVPVQPS